MSELSESELCEENSEFAVGLMFFSKMNPVLIFLQDERAWIIWVKGNEWSDDKTNDKSFMRYWWIFALVLFILIVLFMLLNSKKKDKEDVLEEEGDYTPVW